MAITTTRTAAPAWHPVTRTARVENLPAAPAADVIDVDVIWEDAETTATTEPFRFGAIAYQAPITPRTAAAAHYQQAAANHRAAGTLISALA